MNEKIPSRYQFAAQIMIIFAIEVLFVAITGKIFGNEAGIVSSMYQLGDKGIADSTIFQLLLCSFIITCITTFLSSSKFFKNMMVVWKTVLVLALVLIVIVLFIACFKWFPLDYWQGWVGFLLSFGVCFIGSTILMIIKTKTEEKKYDELLTQYKNKKEKE